MILRGCQGRHDRFIGSINHFLLVAVYMVPYRVGGQHWIVGVLALLIASIARLPRNRAIVF